LRAWRRREWERCCCTSAAQLLRSRRLGAAFGAWSEGSTQRHCEGALVFAVTEAAGLSWCRTVFRVRTHCLNPASPSPPHRFRLTVSASPSPMSVSHLRLLYQEWASVALQSLNLIHCYWNLRQLREARSLAKGFRGWCGRALARRRLRSLHAMAVHSLLRARKSAVLRGWRAVAGRQRALAAKVCEYSIWFISACSAFPLSQTD
jgi:hypothetical protein